MITSDCAVSQLGLLEMPWSQYQPKFKQKFTFSIYGQLNQFPCIAGFLLENIHYAIRSNSYPLLVLTLLLCILHKWSISSCYLQVCQSHNKICLSSPSPNAKPSIHLISSCNYFVWILQQKPSLFLIITHCETECAPDLFELLCVNLVMKIISLQHYPMPNRATIWETALYKSVLLRLLTENSLETHTHLTPTALYFNSSTFAIVCFNKTLGKTLPYVFKKDVCPQEIGLRKSCGNHQFCCKTLIRTTFRRLNLNSIQLKP